MVIKFQRLLVLGSLTLLLSACQEVSTEPAGSIGDLSAACREFNDGLVYNAEFARIFSLETDQAIEMDPGLMAVRVYWTELVYVPDSPKMQMQLYLEPSINLQFPKDEGTHNGLEYLVRSGFRYFQHGNVPFDISNDEFNFRYVIQDGDELVSTYLYRYRTNLTSTGIQAIELGTTFRRNPVVYLYIGEDDPLESGRGQLRHDLAAGKSHDPERFLKLRIPRELQPIMQSPYRPCQGTTVQR
ncbi:hypothetical protein ADINL_2326 [Nitrincola lacisaponensis]|uniref:Lipoprotein n=1 Tax=Nitrincola lacisaponensis TaxID=267850 RepID=A0A063Y3U1_9GAMM|nr:hypothetical protein [Nitrincola lacisaponensis]KDE39197.1 hypothetical protein ADINL_2326 [Nitrincola lacisaponensis]